MAITLHSANGQLMSGAVLIKTHHFNRTLCWHIEMVHKRRPHLVLGAHITAYAGYVVVSGKVLASI